MIGKNIQLHTSKIRSCFSKDQGNRKELKMLEKAENEILTLRKVLPSDLDAVARYRAEFLEKGGSMDGCSNLRRYTCPEHWVPDTQYISVRRSDGRLIGMLDIRKELNEDLLNFYGNVGYSIRHSERRKGYAAMQLKLAKEICRNMGMKKILISCYKENPASAKIILRSGGVLENEVVDQRNGKILQRYWITL